jgi:predicted nuclease of predicted toxin-antitoxin system
MKLRFQADNDLDQRIVTVIKLLDPAIDFQTASTLGLHNIPDLEVLMLAAQQGRILVSHD